jgi:ATP-binding cassette subfamily F protein 2
MSGELLPSLGDIRPHLHLKMGRFTQHFVDVLDLNMTPLEFFESQYPDDPREEQRKYLGRFGVSGPMQVRKMEELSDGQKSRVVFAKLGREAPHILLLDEPTNFLDMEAIDALAKAVNEFEGGLVLVSHDMRLISQVAKEIWICDDKTITKYHGDIQNFKMDMRVQMGIDEGEPKKAGDLRGDASVKKKAGDAPPKKKETPKAQTLDVVPPPSKKSNGGKAQDDDDATVATSTTASSFDTDTMKQSLPAVSDGAQKRYIPPHLRKKVQT